MINLDAEIKSVLNDALVFVVGKLKEELKAQGHVLTGNLLNSIQISFIETGDEIIGGIISEEYGLALDKGVRAKRIPYKRGSGAKSSKYIAALIRFFELRGLGPKNARSAAFATANVHKREGMPTQNSFKYSSNGRRTGWISDTVAKVGVEVDTMVYAGLGTKVVDKIIEHLNNIK